VRLLLKWIVKTTNNSESLITVKPDASIRIETKLTYRSDRKNLIYRSAKKKNWHIHPYRWNLLICQLSSIRKAMPGYIYTKGYVRFHLYGRICQVSSIWIDMSVFLYADRYCTFFSTDRYVSFFIRIDMSGVFLYGSICQVSSIRMNMSVFFLCGSIYQIFSIGSICQFWTYPSV
jgi:hypothetical protein